MDLLRVGKISAVNYDEGKCRVVYSDRDDATTVELPLIVFNNEYYVPEVDDQCVVLHQPNGAASAFVLGDFWSQTHETPDDTGKGVRVKYFDRDGKCYWKYEDSGDHGDGEGDFEFHNDDKVKGSADDDTEYKCKGDIKIKGDKQIEIQGATKVTVKSDGSVEITAGTSLTVKGTAVTVQGTTVNINGTLTINGTPYMDHIHGNGNRGAATTGVIN